MPQGQQQMQGGAMHAMQQQPQYGAMQPAMQPAMMGMGGMPAMGMGMGMGVPMGGLQAMQGPGEVAQEVCRDFQRGHCPRAPRCSFLHVAPDPSQAVPGNPLRPREVCRDFRRGSCPRGSSCSFMHFLNGKQVCRDFNRGTCPRGADCNFVHFNLDTGTHPGEAELVRKRPRLDNEPDDRGEYYQSIMDENASLRKDNTALRQENLLLRKEIEALKKLSGTVVPAASASAPQQPTEEPTTGADDDAEATAELEAE